MIDKMEELFKLVDGKNDLEEFFKIDKSYMKIAVIDEAIRQLKQQRSSLKKQKKKTKH